MNFTRRETMAVSGAALAASILPIKLMVSKTLGTHALCIISKYRSDLKT